MAAKSENGTELNLITGGTVFEGKLRTPGSIRIDGKIVGEIVATQNVSLGSAGDIDGNVSARNVTIGGKIKGTIVAQEKLVFESKAVVRGDIKAAKLVVDEGAVFDGRCVMAEVKPAGMPPQSKPDSQQTETK